MNFLLLVFISSGCILGVEILKRKFSLSTSYTRRLIHLTTATIAGISPLFITQREIILICLFFVVVLFVGRRSNIFSAIYAVERKTFGEIFLPLGVALNAFLFLPESLVAFQFGIFIMGISDALAGLVGENFGKHTLKFFGHKKSLEGSCTFFLMSLVLMFLFVPVMNSKLFLIPLLLTLVELSLVFGLDNLVLPVVSSFLIQNFL